MNVKLPSTKATQKSFTFLTLFICTFNLFSQNEFITTWKTDNPGGSNNSSITIPTFSGETYNYDVDWDNDGYVDAAARKTAQEDLWHFNSTTGRFDAITPNIGANSSNKGAITFCDLDQDGDFDFIWSASSGSNNTVIYTQDNGTFTFAQNLLNDGGIDECDCADVDNDGDNDIFLGDDAGASYLYKNNT